MQKLLADVGCDALVLVAGIDGGDSVEVAQALAYLSGAAPQSRILSRRLAYKDLEDVVLCVYPHSIGTSAHTSGSVTSQLLLC